MSGAKSQLGQSMVEILISAFILAVLTIALVGVATLGTKTAVVSEQRTVAQALVNKKVELIKLTPYLDVGFSDGGSPDGIFLSTETVVQNDSDYVIMMDFELVDDPENGCEDLGGLCDGSTIDESTADYKQVVVRVKYPAADNASKEVVVSTFSVSGQAAALLGTVECDPIDTTGSCPAGQLCCSERCIPLCEPGACPEGYTCATDGCGCELESCAWCETGECSDDFECVGGGEQCEEGSCTALCVTDSDCPGGESCDGYGVCQPPCTEDAECSSDQVCFDGFCQPPGCLDDGYCATGYGCEDFQCVPTSCPSDPAWCPPNYNCVEDTCMPAVCTEGSCPGSWGCIAGTCEPPWCGGSQPCQNGSCVQGECQPPTCGSHEDCQGDAVCLAGTCSDPPACPPACPGTLTCSAGQCVNPNRDVDPVLINVECPAPVTYPCLPAIGEVTITWRPIEGTMLCEPTIDVDDCTIASDPANEWSDTDGDGITNCAPPGTFPTINECTPFYPIECGSSCPGCPACPVNESCIEGRCMPDQPCPVDYAPHPTIAGACVEEMSTVPQVICPASCPGSAYCSAGQCVTAGCISNEQCEAAYGAYMCRNYMCIPKYDRDCSYCIPPERIQYCYGYDCPTCGGGAGTACTDPVGVASTVVWMQDEATGCDHLTCEYAASNCGNNITQPGEDCDGIDDANCPGVCNGSCQCPAAACGNGVVDIGEQCDTAIIEPPVQCPMTGPGTCDPVTCYCPSQTPAPQCGNGQIDEGEDCDPLAVPEGCGGGQYCDGVDCLCYGGSPSGTPPPGTCGDGNLDPGEACDDPPWDCGGPEFNCVSCLCEATASPPPFP